MISRLSRLSKPQQAKLLDQAEATLESWNEAGHPVIVWDGRQHIAELNNEYETVLALYRCKCGQYVATYQDYEGCIDECPKCGASYE